MNGEISCFSDLQPGDQILYLNEDDEEHPFVDQGEIHETYPPCTSDYGDHIPLRHAVWPSGPDSSLYIVQHKDVLDCL
jgi:hypothetical protein